MNIHTYEKDTDGDTPPENIGLNLERESTNHSVCAICMLTFCVDETVAWSLRLTTCAHVFHSSCLREWFKASDGYNCPYCRGDFRGSKDGSTFSILQIDEQRQARTINEMLVNKGVIGSQIICNRNECRFCIRDGHGLTLPEA